MEHYHMPVTQHPPESQPGNDLESASAATLQLTDLAALPADASAIMETSPDRRDAEHEPTLRLPPLRHSFPDDPTSELAPIQPQHEGIAALSAQTLPPLASVTGAQAHAPLRKPPEPSPSTNHWPSLNPFTTYYTPSHLMPSESPTPRGSDRGSVDEDERVRIAALALGEMKTHGSSPRHSGTSQASSPSDRKSSRDRSDQADGEPFFMLLTSLPLVGSTLEGVGSAYNSGKNYSPHIKTGAEYVESYLRPVGKVVGNVSRKSGVGGGVRWIFGRNRKQQAPADGEADGRGNSKRRKSNRDGGRQEEPRGSPLNLDVEDEDRRMSISTVDTLPAYDDQRSPAYTEVADVKMTSGPNSPGPGQQWGQRLVVTTSGLGVAMKEESLKSLRYCLQVLKDTNGYLNDALGKLKSVIDEYDAALKQDGEDHAMADSDNQAAHTAEDRNRLLQRMSELRSDIFNIIHRAVDTVSKYAGGALPENARDVVSRQLMSLPRLYQVHYMRETQGRRENASSEAWARDSAHLALLFAGEAVNMMFQVADVLGRTLESAEEWCEKLYGRKDGQSPAVPSGTPSLPATPANAADQDVKMSG